LLALVRWSKLIYNKINIMEASSSNEATTIFEKLGGAEGVSLIA
jgi:hypothetical protein